MSVIGSIETKAEPFTYEWVIRELELLPEKRGKCIFSPTFRTAYNDGAWELVLYPCGRHLRDADHVSLYLQMLSGRAGSHNVLTKIELSFRQIGITEKFRYVFNEPGGRGCGKFMQTSNLLKLCDSEHELRIRCKIDPPREFMGKTRDTERAPDPQEGLLSRAFRPLFKESMLSDVIVIVGDQKFPAHKVILAARSPIFYEMFKHKETYANLENKVKIEDLEPSVVEAMLEFFYTDEVVNLEGLACGLLGAAVKYDVPRLRSMCEEFLYKTLNDENAAEILMHADLYRSHELKKQVMDFMDDHLSSVVETDSYKEMEKKSPALLGELIRSFAVRKKSKKRKLTE